MKLKPINPTKLARFERLLAKVDEIFQEIEKMENVRSDKNIVSMLKATKEVFSESIENFKSLDLNDKLLTLACESFKSGMVCMRIMMVNLKNEATLEIDDLLKKSGLLCCVVV